MNQDITSNQDTTWDYTACHDVYVDYLEKSVSCGKNGWKTGTLRTNLGGGVFMTESGLYPCAECDQQVFQWTEWTIVGDKKIRSRGKSNIIGSFQKEEKPGKLNNIVFHTIYVTP